MTLIFTYRTDNGIIMTADSAIFDKNKEEVTDCNRLKLLKIPYLNAGISFYGKAKIDKENTGIWLKRFIDENVDKIETIEEFTEKLGEKLNSEIGKIDTDTGFHICGYSAIDENKKAVFHHLTNKLKNDYWDEELRDEFYDAGFLNPDDFRIGTIIHNGDYFIFNILFRYLYKEIWKSIWNIILEFQDKRKNIYFPLESDLEGQKDILLILLNIVKEIYRLFAKYNSKFNPIVDGNISYILISKEGIEKYEPSGSVL